MSIRLLLMAIMNAARAVIEWLELDYMEYSSDANAQAAYVTNGTGTNNSINGSFESWTGATLNSWTIEGGAPAVVKESTTIKVGTYSLKINGASQNNWSIRQNIAGVLGINYWKGKKITYGCWIKASVGNKFRLEVWDGVALTESSAHTGSGNWEWIQLTHTISGSATELFLYLLTNKVGNITDIAYYDGAVAVEGNAVFDGVSALNYLQSFSEPTIKTQGSYALKAVAAITDSLGKTLTKTFSPTKDLSGKTQIKYDVRASRTGSNFKLGWHDSGGTTTEHTPNILVADTWQEETVDISAVADANKDAIDSLITTILNADATNTIYIDNVRYS